MATVRDLIEGSLRLINEPGRGKPINGSDASDGLDAYNDFISSLSSDGLIIPSRTKESFSLVVSQNTYSYGSGGDFSSARPNYIEHAWLQDGNYDYVLRTMDEGQYSRIVYKKNQTRPTRFYYEPNYPTGTIYLDSDPEKVYTIWFNALKPITEFTGLSQSVSLPNEYKQFLKFNMAVLLAPEYEKEASATVMREADRSMKRIKKLNGRFRIPVSTMDSGLVRGETYNYYTD